MAIPEQGEFLLPFLEILNDGYSHLHDDIESQLADHFQLTETERKEIYEKSNTRIIVNRVAWCDVHFCKAGFATKDKNAAASEKDVFRITPLGLKGLKENPEQITIGYLQSLFK